MSLQPKDNPEQVDGFYWKQHAEELGQGRVYTLYLQLPDSLGPVDAGGVQFKGGVGNFYNFCDLVPSNGWVQFETAAELGNILKAQSRSLVAAAQRSIRMRIFKVWGEFAAANPQVINTYVTKPHSHREALLAHFSTISEDPSALVPTADWNMLKNIGFLMDDDFRLADKIRETTASDLAVLVKLVNIGDEVFGAIAQALVMEESLG